MKQLQEQKVSPLKEQELKSLAQGATVLAVHILKVRTQIIGQYKEVVKVEMVNGDRAIELTVLPTELTMHVGLADIKPKASNLVVN